MNEEYSGYLKTLLREPNEAEREQAESIVFTSDDIAAWTTSDVASDLEWRDIPAQRTRTPDGVRLLGRFDDVRRIDSLSSDDPSFWVPLGTLGWNDPRFPIDLNRYPIVEITYRCTSENARPAWVWRYPGGLYLDYLPATRRWRTIIRRIPHFGFPNQVDSLVFRLYSASRSTETVEIQSIRFRAMTPTEAEATANNERHLLEEAKPKHYPLLDEFMPLGVYMNALSARRLAEMLGISIEEYWNFAFEDVATHRHNTIILEDVSGLSPVEWRELVALAASHALRLVPVFDLGRYETLEQQRQFVEERIKPYAESEAILAWSLYDEPPEHEFPNLLRLGRIVEEMDPNHPLVVITRHPSAYPLYAPFFAASGIDHYTSHAPWEFAEMVHSHAALARGQQFWMVAPAFVYATGTPEWSSCAEMRLMVNLTFANGARGWSVFAYHNDPMWIHGSCQRSLTGPFLTFSDLWAELGERMERFHALAPLLLQAEPARMPEQWYATSAPSSENLHLPEGLTATSSFRLRGPNYNLYFVVSNNVRGMASVNIKIPREIMHGLEIYDVFDFCQNRVWEPMNLERHLEMFPGQARVVLVAAPDVCAHYGEVLAKRLAEEDRRQLEIELKLARVYDLPLAEIEELLSCAGTGGPFQELNDLDRAQDMMVDLLYEHPTITPARTGITEASAIVCACDGALCRLLARGLHDEAREFGLKVVPLAREIAHLRIELRQGRADAVLPQCESLTKRAQRLLAEIRSLSH
ncbi:MAG: hypothetical protein RBU21_07220 [FCB group bacterium]|jgi:hypothetical protein|nr:hypothetical protein [FCB group bacterium]